MTSAAFWLDAPMTTRSGLRKSSMAEPSLRNSGFETTLKGCLVFVRTSSATFFAVPTGTVLLVTTMALAARCGAISRVVGGRSASCAGPMRCW